MSAAFQPPTPPPTAPNPATACARVVLDELARCGVRHVVMAPGSRSTALVVAAHEHPELLLHVEVDERSAGFLALGLARATGQPAVVVTTSGSAVANLHPAVVEAHHDRVPLLLLTADRPPELHGVGANQTIDQLGIFGDGVRWTVDLGVPQATADEVARWRWTACRAHGVAVGRPVEAPAVVGLDSWREPGPVHVNAPFREPTVPVTDDGRTRATPFVHPLAGREGGAPWATAVAGPRAATAHALEVAVEALRSVERGLVVVGGGVDGPLGDVHALAAALGWPLHAEPHSGAWRPGVVPHGSLLLGSEPFARAHAPQLVLRIGRLTVDRGVTRLVSSSPQLVVDEHGGWLDPQDERSTLLRGDVAPTVAALLARLAPGPGVASGQAAWRRRWHDAGRDVADVVADALADDGEASAVRALVAALPDGAALVVGSSMAIRHVDLVAAPRDGLTVHANRGTSGIDGFASTALGVALAHDGPTVALCGDLTLLHDSAGWLLSPDPTLGEPDLVTVVLDNDGGGIFSLLPQRQHVDAFERVFGTPHGRDLAHLAALHELTLHRPAPGALVGAVQDAIAAGGRHLVLVRGERDATAHELTALRRAVADAFGAG